MALLRAFGAAVMVSVLGSAVACQNEEATQPLIVAADILWDASICADPDGVNLEGLSVSVIDEQGEEIARARLGSGGPPDEGMGAQRFRFCRFKALVHVPDRTSYTVVAEDGDPLTYTHADLEGSGWVATILPPEDLAP